MSILRIGGGTALSGSVSVHGAKNSVLPIMAASILGKGETLIHNCPRLSDVDAAVKILRYLGCRVERDGSTVFIDSSPMDRCDIPDALMREMRSSSIFLGAVLGRAGKAVLSMPGGCELGPRPIDMHLKAMRGLGAFIDERGGNLLCSGEKLRGCRIDLAFPSVGATENSMIAACAASGTTTITNAAMEPEIRDLADYLGKLGANIKGAGTSIIVVEGGRPDGFYTEHRVIPDRIVASTYLAAAASSGGTVDVTDIVPGDLRAVTDAFSEMGCRLKVYSDSISIDASNGLKAPRPITTRPYPGFPTDAQPMVLAACTLAKGTAVFVETIFENRYRHVEELRRMGADIKVDGRVAMVSGVDRLFGASVVAGDLRGGAALVTAALAAEGMTEVSGVKHIDRGYDGLAESLRSLGADIVRIA